MTIGPTTGVDNAWVFIKVANNPGDDGNYNRIWLQCESVSITTGKTVAAFPVPFSGMVTGESTSLAIDLGMASKTINLTGIITEHEVKKKFKDGEIATEDVGVDGGATRNMTAQEIAQLLHSYVDSSFMQKQQNLNEMVILYPSYINKHWEYHTGLSATSVLEDAKMLPFNWGVRDAGTIAGLDARGSIGGSAFPVPITTNTENIEGVKGFIRNFNTSFDGGNPFVTFTMDFEVAITIGL